jgi:hypothetical protein
MQYLVNEERVKRGERVGKYATVAGLVLLVGGLLVSLLLQESGLWWVSFLFLIVGILVSSVGTMNMNRWVRVPRADQALAQALKGFDDRYQLYNYYLPAPHVLLSPLGLFVLTAMGQDGKITFDGTRFRRDFSLGRVLRFMADEGLGRPLAEAEAQVNTVRQHLEENGIEDEVDIQNIMVFFHPKVELDVGDPPVPIANPKGLKKALRRNPDAKLPGDLYRRIEEIFDAELV